jgi:glyceraldehyde-3-phosphate dehydrogenase/erythrose-4-phosphate dehydrogenase
MTEIAIEKQQVLDRLPGKSKTDLRKNRSILNDIILTTTGAARALALVIPEMRGIGFIAESVRIPTTTGSLIILVLSLQEETAGQTVTARTINRIYADAAKNDPNDYLHFSEKQNVSGDIVGIPRKNNHFRRPIYHKISGSEYLADREVKYSRTGGMVASRIPCVDLQKHPATNWQENQSLR